MSTPTGSDPIGSKYPSNTVAYNGEKERENREVERSQRRHSTVVQTLQSTLADEAGAEDQQREQDAGYLDGFDDPNGGDGEDLDRREHVDARDAHVAQEHEVRLVFGRRHQQRHALHELYARQRRHALIEEHAIQHLHAQRQPHRL